MVRTVPKRGDYRMLNLYGMQGMGTAGTGVSPYGTITPKQLAGMLGVAVGGRSEAHSPEVVAALSPPPGMISGSMSAMIGQGGMPGGGMDGGVMPPAVPAAGGMGAVASGPTQPGSAELGQTQAAPGSQMNPVQMLQLMQVLRAALQAGGHGMPRLSPQGRGRGA